MALPPPPPYTPYIPIATLPAPISTASDDFGVDDNDGKFALIGPQDSTVTVSIHDIPTSSPPNNSHLGYEAVLADDLTVTNEYVCPDIVELLVLPAKYKYEVSAHYRSLRSKIKQA